MSDAPRRPLGWWLAGVLGLAAIAWLSVRAQARFEQDLDGMPATERRALYERTRETLRTACAQATGATLAEHCRLQAAFIERFPECDRECRDLARRHTPRPTR